MWIFTEIGYFSAVRYRTPEENPSEPQIAVRARVRDDIERLADMIEHEFKHDRPEVLEWPNRDYPYRVIISREVWADVLMSLAERIEYSNFKDHVKKINGPKRASLYSGVWSRMLHAESELGKVGTNKSIYGRGGRYATRDIPPELQGFDFDSLPAERPTRSFPRNKKK